MSYININGKIQNEQTAIITANSRAFRYGDGIFETIKLQQSVLVFGNEHFARLWRGMQLFQFDIPKHFSPEKLQEQIMTLATKNGHQHAARVRLTIFRGDGGLYDAKNHTPNYVIQTWQLPEGNGHWNSNGLVLGFFTDALKVCDHFSNCKHNNYLPYLMGALHAKKQLWNDAIITNCRSQICDTTIANIFIVKDDIIYTPPLADGCVAGIMRQELLQFLKSNGYNVLEQSLSTTDVMAANEVFLTNSMYNIRWVKSIGDAVFSNTITQKIYTTFIPTIN
jgi:branched-chain amino acid aminotransferase